MEQIGRFRTDYCIAIIGNTSNGGANEHIFID